jgi:hypothetical protein
MHFTACTCVHQNKKRAYSLRRSQAFNDPCECFRRGLLARPQVLSTERTISRTLQSHMTLLDPCCQSAFATPRARNTGRNDASLHTTQFHNYSATLERTSLHSTITESLVVNLKILDSPSKRAEGALLGKPH